MLPFLLHGASLNEQHKRGTVALCMVAICHCDPHIKDARDNRKSTLLVYIHVSLLGPVVKKVINIPVKTHLFMNSTVVLVLTSNGIE